MSSQFTSFTSNAFRGDTVNTVIIRRYDFRLLYLWFGAVALIRAFTAGDRLGFAAP